VQAYARTRTHTHTTQAHAHTRHTLKHTHTHTLAHTCALARLLPAHARTGGTITELDPDAPPRQGRGLHPDNAKAEERLTYRLWQLVRAGEVLRCFFEQSHAHTHARTHTRAHTRTHTRTHAHTHAHTHTQNTFT